MMRHVTWTVVFALGLAGIGMAEDGNRRPVELSPILVYGHVVDAQGQPVPEATATLEMLPSLAQQFVELLPDGSPPEPWLEVPADDRGHFVLWAPEHGLYTVRLEAPGYLPMEHVLEPLLSDTRLPTAVLPLDEGTGVHVVTADGLPGKGARLVVYPSGTWPRARPRAAKDEGWQSAIRRLEVGPDGMAHLPHASREVPWVYTILPGHALWAWKVDSEAKSQQIELEAIGRTRLVTVRWGSRPLPAALLVHSRVPLGRTDASGRVALRSKDLWKGLTLMTADGGFEAVKVSTEGSRIAVESGGRRGGRVTDHFRHFSIPNAVIWSPADRHAVRADAKGQFRWPFQRFRGPLRVAAPGFFPSYVLDVDGSRGLLKMTMQPSAEIIGRVVSEDGKPMAWVPIEAYLEDRSSSPNPEPRWETVSRPDGSFRLSGISGSKKVDVWARPDGWVPTFRTVTMPLMEEKPYQTEPVELVLKRDPS